MSGSVEGSSFDHRTFDAIKKRYAGGDSGMEEELIRTRRIAARMLSTTDPTVAARLLEQVPEYFRELDPDAEPCEQTIFEQVRESVLFEKTSAFTRTRTISVRVEEPQSGFQGFDAQGNVLWADTSSVVRAGGRRVTQQSEKDPDDEQKKPRQRKRKEKPKFVMPEGYVYVADVLTEEGIPLGLGRRTLNRHHPSVARGDRGRLIVLRTIALDEIRTIKESEAANPIRAREERAKAFVMPDGYGFVDDVLAELGLPKRFKRYFKRTHPDAVLGGRGRLALPKDIVARDAVIFDTQEKEKRAAATKAKRVQKTTKLLNESEAYLNDLADEVGIARHRAQKVTRGMEGLRKRLGTKTIVPRAEAVALLQAEKDRMEQPVIKAKRVRRKKEFQVPSGSVFVHDLAVEFDVGPTVLKRYLEGLDGFRVIPRHGTIVPRDAAVLKIPQLKQELEEKKRNTSSRNRRVRKAREGGDRRDDDGIYTFDDVSAVSFGYLYKTFGIAHNTLSKDLAGVKPLDTKGTHGEPLYPLDICIKKLAKRIDAPKPNPETGIYTDADKEQWGTRFVFKKMYGISYDRFAKISDDVPMLYVKTGNGQILPAYNITEIVRRNEEFEKTPLARKTANNKKRITTKPAGSQEEESPPMASIADLCQEFDISKDMAYRIFGSIAVKQGKHRMHRWDDARRIVAELKALPLIDKETKEYVDDDGMVHVTKSEAVVRIGLNSISLTKIIREHKIEPIPGRSHLRGTDLVRTDLYSLAAIEEAVEADKNKSTAVNRPAGYWTPERVLAACIEIYQRTGEITTFTVNDEQGLLHEVQKRHGGIGKIRERVIQVLSVEM